MKIHVKKFISKVLSVILIVTILLSSFQGMAFAKTNNDSTTKKMLIQYKYNSQNSEKKIKGINKKYKNLKNKDIFSADLDNVNFKELSKDSNIQYMEEDAPIKKLDDSITWNIKAVNADSVHKNNVFGEGIKVALFDTGIDLHNNDLAVSGGVSFVDGVQSYDDDNGHGTAMAGILASTLNNQGLLGVAPKIELYSVKVMDKNGNGYYSNIIQGIQWAIDNHINIIAMSFGGTQYSEILNEAIKNATYNDILVIAASGNDGSKNILYPANYPDVVCVGATNITNSIAEFTNTGEQMDLVAPGVDVESADSKGASIKVSGTSAAVQHVAGVAALAWSVDRSLSIEQLKAVMYKNATALGDTKVYGWGLVNAKAACENISETDFTQSPSSQKDHVITNNSGEGSVSALEYSDNGQQYFPNIKLIIPGVSGTPTPTPTVTPTPTPIPTPIPTPTPTPTAIPINSKIYFGNTSSNQKVVGDPVNIITGNFFSTHTDLHIPDIGDNALEIERYYNSLDTRMSMMGIGWRMNYDSFVDFDSETGNATVTYPDGHTITFEYLNGHYIDPDMVYDTLVKNTDGTTSLKLQSKTIYNYNSSGKLVSIMDRNNNAIIIKYDSSNHISQVIGASGKKLIFTYTGGKISKVSDPIGRTLEYTYDSSGNLIQVKGTGGGIMKYQYDENGLTSITDENGKKYITNKYNVNKRVIRQLNESGDETLYYYDDVNKDNSIVLVSSGITTRYRYNDQLYITRENYYDGTYKEYSYDSYGNRTSTKDENGNITRNTYDLRGNETSMTEALGNTVTYSYDSKDNLTGLSTLSGSQTTLSYDENANLLQVTKKIDSQTNAKTWYTYDSYGRLLSVTDAEGNLTTFQYDGGSQPISATDPEGNITKYGYDALDRRTSITNADGTTTFTYNDKDKIEKITDPSGNITRMEYDAGGNLIKSINPGQYDKSLDDGKGYTYAYDGMDRLIRETDPYLASGAAKYDENGNLIKEVNPNYYNATTDDGLGYKYEYDGHGWLIKTTNPSGQQSRIKYDPVGNVIAVITANNYNEASNSGLAFSYEYDANNQLVNEKDTDGNIIHRMTYDSDGNVVKEMDAKGYLSGADDNSRYGTLYSYNLAGWLVEKKVPLKKENGTIYYQITRYTYDKTGKLLTEKTSQEYITLTGEPTVWNTISYTYDKNGNAKTVSDSNGGQIEYTYDAMGRVVQDKTLMEGSKYIINGYEYDKSGNLVKKWNEVNSKDLSEGGTGTVQAVTVMEYDKNGNLTKETSPEGYVTTYEYDDNNRLVAENKQVSEDTITVKSNSLSIKSSKKTLYPGESYHFKLEMNVTGAVKGLDTEVKYDERLMEVVSANTDVEGLTIDTSTPGVIKLSAKNTNIKDKTTLSNITMRIKEGFAGTAYIIPSGEGLWSDAKGQYHFNSLSGKLLSVKAPDMNNDGIVDVSDLTLTAREDGMKQGNSSYDEKYDITGDDVINDADLDYIKDWIFAGDTMVLDTMPSIKTAEKSTKSSYTKSSAIVTRTTTYEYDKAGNLIKETDCNGNSIQYDYDAYDRVIRVTDQDGNTTRAFYDEEGNITKVVDPEHYDPKADDGKGETYVYDTMGRLLDVYDASGILAQKNTYDKDGLLTYIYDATGKALEYAYDIGGREISETTPKAKESEKISQEYSYDAMGYITSITDGNGNTTFYERDMWGRALKVTDPNGVLTQCTYDNLGNPTRVTDGKGNPTTYVYNTWNQLSAVTDAQGLTEQYLYDREGNLTKKTDRNGNTFCYTYNSDGNLTKKEVQGAELYNEYLYNKDGSLLAAMNNNTVDTYDYTLNGTVKSVARNGKTILNYLTDKNGNITRVTDAKGDYTGYTYDAEGRLDTVTDGETVAAAYTYNPDSTIAGIKYSTGINTIYGYDSDKNITRLVSKKADGRTLESYSYTYDNNGNQLTKKENGETTTYVYDKLNHLAEENKTTYTYDNAGNRLSKSDGTDKVTYSYDRRNMLTQESKNGIITTYNYDKNGNLTEESDGTQYSYNAFNQLVETDKKDGTWQQNIYDATGLRMATVENGTYTGYTFDRDNILAEYDKDDSLTTRYIRGYDLISQKNDAGETYHYLHNAHGDITKLVDTAGKVQNSYSYDAFGNTISYSEKVGNQFRYAGEQYDSITGEYYLRARYYEPAMGRFMNEDTYRGQIENPQSMNLYAYCENNPVINTDPSGHRASKKCSSGNSTKDTTRAIAEYFIANPAAVNITQHPDWVTEQLFYAFGFKRDDSTGVYHARQDALQQYGGYNFLYDIVFDYATSMAAQPFEFTYNGQDYRFWAWKGDYLNLGSGAELGLYKRLSVYGIQTPHWLVDTSLALPMTLTLKDNKGNLIASYNPSEPQWWITAFNPNKQNVNAKDLRVTYTIDFSGNKKSKGMFKAFYKRWYRQDRRLTFYKKKYKVTFRF